MKTALIITDNPENPQLLEGCMKLEEVGFKTWIDKLNPLNEDELFTWIIFSFENPYTKEFISSLNSILANSATPIKIILQEPLDLVTQCMDAGLDVYSDWNNLIERNFFT